MVNSHSSRNVYLLTLLVAATYVQKRLTLPRVQQAVKVMSSPHRSLSTKGRMAGLWKQQLELMTRLTNEDELHDFWTFTDYERPHRTSELLPCVVCASSPGVIQSQLPMLRSQAGEQD